jgi:hypothetical protein
LSLALQYHACFLASLVGMRKRIADAMGFVPPVSFRLYVHGDIGLSLR